METIGAYEAKTHLPRLLDEVASGGKTFMITKHGVPVARLGPAGRSNERPADVIAAIREARKGHHLGDLTVREMIDEGRE